MPAVGGFVFDSSGAPIDRGIRVYRRDTGALLGKTRSSGGDGDPHFDKVSLLLHMDGADGSTAFVDQMGVECLPIGNARISTARGVYGGSSLLLDGSLDGLRVNHSSAMDFGTNDFTVEMWVYVIAHTNATAALVSSGGSGWNPGECTLRFDTGSVISLYTHDSGIVVGTVAFPVGQWRHVAMCRVGRVVSIYLHGISVASGSMSGPLNFSNKGLSFLGHTDFDKQSLNGNIAEFRVTKGVARYTANFTPPAARLPDIPGAGRTLAFGEYYFLTQHTGEVNVVCLDDASASLENDLILRTFPV